MTKMILFFAGLFAISQEASAQAGSFMATGDMTTARFEHTATLLMDGRVLLTGGVGVGSAALSSAELYDPSTGTFSRTGAMTAARRMHSATRLADGRVLIAGGWGLSSAEIYDPATATFTATSSMFEDQGGHAAILLPDGTVLIAGGEREAGPWPTAARAELYDPASGTFSFAAPYAGNGTLYLAGGPIWPTANLLPDGRVLIVGENPPELYDPVTGTFSLTGRMVGSVYAYGMDWHTATSLRDGTVLVTGGSDDFSCGGGFSNAEIYNPSSGTFSTAGNMMTGRDIHTATLLNDGTVFLAGGGDGWCFTPTRESAELYDPSTRSFVAVGKMSQSRSAHTATLLNDGTVLLAGGMSYWPFRTTASAELYRPAQTRSGRTRLRH